MIIDEFLPVWDVQEKHSIEINASDREVMAATRRMELSRAQMTNFLLKLRGIPAKTDFSLDDFLKMSFVILGETPNKELLLGLTGKFWQPNGDLVRIERENFVQFNKPGYTKAIWNFSLSEISNGAVRLNAETRVFCTDLPSRIKFMFYWFFIGAFSGLIRREILCAIKRTAEKNYQ